MKVKAEVCLSCGERLYHEETIRKFDEVRKKLANRETQQFERIGTSYQVS